MANTVCSYESDSANMSIRSFIDVFGDQKSANALCF